jgi:hypothetical protein
MDLALFQKYWGGMGEIQKIINLEDLNGFDTN